MQAIRSIGFSLLAGAATFAAVPFLPAKETRSPVRQPVVQLALLLDTSNSMDGLIDQARTRLWSIVNELACARHAGLHPRLEVALYEYGNDRLSREAHFIREVSPFTDDLDVLSEKLFSLRTDGGKEYCGAVIARAVDQLDWSRHGNDLKLVFIAGNEPFDQGPVDYHHAVRTASLRGITINTIYCGPRSEGIATYWKNGAHLAEGTFATIDQNRIRPVVDAPQDREIAALNLALNLTYLAYGPGGRARAEVQARQDSYAASASPSVLAQRAAAKSSNLYNNRSWDLVDAVNEGTIDVEKMAEEDLPVDLRNLTAAERQARIQAMADERKQVQERIQNLAAERDTYVAAELRRTASEGASGDAALDDAILNSVRAQAAKLNYDFEK